ncbi:hypothetical protein KC324_g9 [Hortaea werneckii]|nr:hypothetical protein KC324_g9 [Hortaea werneckii]
MSKSERFVLVTKKLAADAEPCTTTKLTGICSDNQSSLYLYHTPIAHPPTIPTRIPSLGSKSLGKAPFGLVIIQFTENLFLRVCCGILSPKTCSVSTGLPKATETSLPILGHLDMVRLRG